MFSAVLHRSSMKTLHLRGYLKNADMMDRNWSSIWSLQNGFREKTERYGSTLKIIIATIKSWNIERAYAMQKQYEGIHQIEVFTKKEE